MLFLNKTRSMIIVTLLETQVNCSHYNKLVVKFTI